MCNFYTSEYLIYAAIKIFSFLALCPGKWSHDQTLLPACHFKWVTIFVFVFVFELLLMLLL